MGRCRISKSTHMCLSARTPAGVGRGRVEQGQEGGREQWEGEKARWEGGEGKAGGGRGGGGEGRRQGERAGGEKRKRRGWRKDRAEEEGERKRPARGGIARDKAEIPNRRGWGNKDGNRENKQGCRACASVHGHHNQSLAHIHGVWEGNPTPNPGGSSAPAKPSVTGRRRKRTEKGMGDQRGQGEGKSRGRKRKVGGRRKDRAEG